MQAEHVQLSKDNGDIPFTLPEDSPDEEAIKNSSELLLRDEQGRLFQWSLSKY